MLVPQIGTGPRGQLHDEEGHVGGRVPEAKPRVELDAVEDEVRLNRILDSSAVATGEGERARPGPRSPVYEPRRHVHGPLRRLSAGAACRGAAGRP